MALLKLKEVAAAASGADGSVIPKTKSSGSKKSLSHNAVLNMAGVGMDSSLCFTSKHGKPKEKMKPRIPATPPGTNRIPKIGSLKHDAQKFINDTCGIPKFSTPGQTSNSTATLPTPKLKIPAPKMKQPEFSTDVLPLPKEDIQEQQERKLQILKKEEKQKELALAVQRGMLGPLGGAIGDSAGAGRPVTTFTGTTEARALLTPADQLLNQVKKEKKDKESKKVNKDVRKDKEKRDKEKKELKEKKLFKKKEEKEKRDKERKEEKKKEKEAKKSSKDLLRRDKEIKKARDGKKIKDGKIVDKDVLKKERKESKKVKKILGNDANSSHHDGGALNPAVPGPPCVDGSPYNQLGDSRQQVNVDVIGGIASPLPRQSIVSPPLSQDSGKNKLCIFKKNSTKPTKETNANSLLEKSSKSDFLDNNFLASKPLNPNLSQLTDISADVTGIISSPSLLDSPVTTKLDKPKKRKRAVIHPDLDDSLGSVNSASPKFKKRKLNTLVSTPKLLPLAGSTSSGVVSMDEGNIMSSSGTDGSHAFPTGFLFNIDSRPPTPGGIESSPILPKFPLTAGTYQFPPISRGGLIPQNFAFTPPPPGHSGVMPSYQYGYPPFNPTDMGATSMIGGDGQIERPHTPGSQQYSSLGGMRASRTPDRSMAQPKDSVCPSHPPLQEGDTNGLIDSSSDLDRKVSSCIVAFIILS